MNWEALDLPDGWQVLSLVDVADIAMGQSPPGHTYNTEGRGLPFFQGKAEFGDDSPATRKWCTSPTRIAEPGDILMSVRAPVGPTNVADQECSVGRGLAIIRAKPDVPSSLLRHAIKLQEAKIASWGTGTTFTAISKRHMQDIKLALPPVELRVGLASVLDAAVKLRRSSTLHLLAARRAIERFRTAVLTSAYQDATDAHGSQGEVALATLLREPFKNGYSARPVGHETPFRVLTLTATTSGWFDDSHFKYTDEQFDEASPFWLAPGDILVQRGNTAEFVGVPAVYEGAARQFLYPDLMIRVRLRPEVNPRFAWYMLLAPQARNYLRDRATGSAGNMPKINQKILADVPVPLPPLESRERLVQRLDAAFAAADSVAQHVAAAHRRIDVTAQAVLAKAFRGDLSSLPTTDLPGKAPAAEEAS